MDALSCKVLVVGGGPGGYVAAIRAGQLGLDTVLVEADRLGGTCLNRGCIPSKALIHGASVYQQMLAHSDGAHMGISLPGTPALDLGGMIAWKDTVVGRLNQGVAGLLKKAGVRVVNGWATFSDAKTCAVDTEQGPLQVSAEHVILATGSTTTSLPGIALGGDVISSSEALNLDTVPAELAIIGAGYIGLELGIAFRKMGSQVTFIEGLDRILPLFDREMTRPIENWLKRHQVDVLCNARAERVETDNGKAVLVYTDASGTEGRIAADKILLTVGRRPNTAGWGLENMCIDMQGPWVKVDQQCRTSMKNVWAIGDLVGEPMLAHKASAQGELVAEIIAGEKAAFEPRAIPAVCFTEPEIVGVGLSPAEAEQQGIETVVGKFPFAAIGRALAMDAGTDGGFVRITARADNHLVIGMHAVGSHVAELSNQFALAMEMGACLEDIAGTIHVHPTLGEATMEAAMAGLGKAIHG